MAVDFVYGSEDLIRSFMFPVEGEENQLSKFDVVLRSQWDHAMEQGYFTYELDDVLTRIVPGKIHFVLQLNPKRGKLKRRAEFVTSLKMPFDPNKFNFNKIRPEEILVNLCFKEKEFRCPVIINMSPLEYGHVLLVPDPKDCLPQVITPHALTVGVHYLLLSSHRGLYVAFNGLCAMASVNHLHLHAWYLEYPTFPQTTRVKQICGDLHFAADLPVAAYVFELCEGDIDRLVRCVFTVCSHLHHQDIAHNVMLLRGSTFENSQKWSVRAFIWPRKSVIDTENFQKITEDDLVSRIQESLTTEQLDGLTQTLCTQYKEIFTAADNPLSLANGI